MLVRVATLIGYCTVSPMHLVATQYRLRLCYPSNQTVIYRAFLINVGWAWSEKIITRRVSFEVAF